MYMYFQFEKSSHRCTIYKASSVKKFHGDGIPPRRLYVILVQ